MRADLVDTHHRTPGYVKGRRGRVQALCGVFPRPGVAGLRRERTPGSGRLYRVEFDQGELWGERYNGPEGDSLLVDIFEQWLEAGVTARQGGE